MGLRAGEVAALSWKDINLDNRTMHINKTFVRLLDNSFELDTPKPPD
ncbi:hypothetical protein KQI18_08390 [Clostridioides mangenotii]|nr:hypothetical protein [Clostridioides mangenotii]MBU5307802.1 hypothetical protein [Clostridioides mangenotii]